MLLITHSSRFPTENVSRISEAGNKGIIFHDVSLGSLDNGQVRLGGSVRNYFSVRTILNSTGHCKLPR